MLESIEALLPVPTRTDYSGMNPAGIVTNQEQPEEAYVPQTLSDIYAPKK